MAGLEGVSASALNVVNSVAEIERASAWLGEFSARAGLSAEVVPKLRIALDEVLSNVVFHGLAQEPEGSREIGLSVRLGAGTIELEVTDDGPAFDPTRVVAAPPPASTSERREGGVGLLFVRVLMDEVKYTRCGDRNHLVLCKRLPMTA